VSQAPALSLFHIGECLLSAACSGEDYGSPMAVVSHGVNGVNAEQEFELHLYQARASIQKWAAIVE